MNDWKHWVSCGRVASLTLLRKSKQMLLFVLLSWPIEVIVSGATISDQAVWRGCIEGHSDPRIFSCSGDPVMMLIAVSNHLTVLAPDLTILAPDLMLPAATCPYIVAMSQVLTLASLVER